MMTNLYNYGFRYMVVAREEKGRFMAPRTSRASNPEAAIKDVSSPKFIDTEDWSEVTEFVVFPITADVQWSKDTVTETPEPIVTVTYERN